LPITNATRFSAAAGSADKSESIATTVATARLVLVQFGNGRRILGASPKIVR
jgi:hypothetical protein